MRNSQIIESAMVKKALQQISEHMDKAPKDDEQPEPSSLNAGLIGALKGAVGGGALGAGLGYGGNLGLEYGDSDWRVNTPVAAKKMAIIGALVNGLVSYEQQQYENTMRSNLRRLASREGQ